MREATTMKATTIGIDLAKHLFQLHGVDQHGKTILKRQLKREQMLSFFSNLPPSLIGMEACGSVHYWANKLQGMGHTVNQHRKMTRDQRLKLTRVNWLISSSV
ncbi:hypothetical protein A9G04_04205 [Aeromonas sp. ANNP30]|nr:hypothetical protein A9G04_04205 [Aeromonas sp. ANNP30]